MDSQPIRDPGPSTPAAHAALLTARDAAALLTISERTLWSMTACGEIAHVRIRRSVRYDPQDLAKFIARHRSRPRPVE
jgi:excisionase family DNA binding protein